MVRDQNGDVFYRRMTDHYVASIKSFSTKPSTKIGGAFLAVSVLITGVAVAQSNSTSNLGTSNDAQTSNNESKIKEHLTNDSNSYTSGSSSSINSHVNNVSSSDDGANTEVRVNGKDITVPPNGSYHKVIKDKNGNVSSVTINSSTNSTNSSSGSTDTSIDTHSYSESYISSERDGE